MVRRRPTRRKPPKKSNPGKSDVERMAALYVHTRSMLVRAGHTLHDHIGSSLSAAGVLLQLLRTDVPSARAQIDETLQILEDVLDCVRNLTRELCPSPAYTGGLKQALFRLSDRHASDNCHIDVEYGATGPVPAEIAVSLYEAGSGVLEQALEHGAKTVNIRVRGGNPLVLRIADDGRKAGRTRALAIIGTLARQQGLAFECSTGKGTIVSIRYAIRRSTRG